MSPTDPRPPVIREVGEHRFLEVDGALLRAAACAAVVTLAGDRAGLPFDVRVKARRGRMVLSSGEDGDLIARGVGDAYAVLASTSTRVEADGQPIANLAAAAMPVDIRQGGSSDDQYEYLIDLLVTEDAKLRGALFQEPPAILNPTAMANFLRTVIPGLVAGRPDPFRVTVVVGGTSAEAVLAMAAEADGGSFDDLPEERDDDGGPVRSRELERLLHAVAEEAGGLGSCSQARVIRGVRHGGSLPIGAYVGHADDQHGTLRIREGEVTLNWGGSTLQIAG